MVDGDGEGDEGVGWREGMRESNQYRKVGDRKAMRKEATDPTYSFADMIIGTLSQLKLILDQNESKGQTETRKELSCGGKERRERGRAISVVRFIFSHSNSGNCYLSLLFS